MMSRLYRLLLATWLLSGGSAPALAETPLLMPGKQTLFQRVITRDEAPRRAQPAAGASRTIEALVPLYVFERRLVDGLEWVRVSASDKDGTDFWLSADEVLDWKQNIVLTFEKHGDFDRMLMFRDVDDVYSLVEAEDPAMVAQSARGKALAAERGEGDAGAVIGLGPRTSVDLANNFYFMPILDWEEALFDTGGQFVKVLEVAVAKEKAAQDAGSVTPPASGDAIMSDPTAFEDYKVGVVFVIDTTVSMQPYIDATQDAMIRMFDTLQDSGLGDRISFGLVGYRDSVEAAPTIGYLSNVYVPLADKVGRTAFLRGMDRMKQADVSTRNFREDAYAGIREALASRAKADVDGLWVVLITDASPRDPDDKFSSTALSAQGIADIALESGAYIATLHLLTDRGAKANDHERARARYEPLSAVPNTGTLYRAIPGGDVEEFRQTALQLTSFIAEDIKKFLPNSGNTAAAEQAEIEEQVSPELIENAQKVAKAMRLSYLGRETGEAAPDVFSGWIADRDYEHREQKPVEIRLLVTKNQLSDLEEALRTIVSRGEEHFLEPDQFFRQIVAAATDASRRPENVGARPDSLADAALIAEYLDGLPYRSQVMNITEDEWLRMNAAEQLQLLDRLSEVAERYRVLNGTPDKWLRLARDGKGELVYPMQFNQLP